MDTKVTWHWQDEERHIMHIKYRAGWTWSDHHQIISETLKVRAQYPDDFMYIIVDMSESIFPKGSPASAQHRNVGQNALMVIVTDNMFVRTLASISIRVRGEDHLYQFAKNLNEANQMIDEHLQNTKMPRPE